MALRNTILAGIVALACSCGNGGAPQDAGTAAGIENKVEKYALLISGNTWPRHVLNLSFTYNFLLEQGFERKNIRVLDEDGKERYYQYPVDGEASRKTIQEAIDALKQTVDRNDHLFIYVSDHGAKSKSEAGDEMYYIALPGENITYLEFAQHMEGLNPGLGFFIFDHCYSGAFAKSLGEGNIAAVSASGMDEISYAGSDEFNSAGIHILLGFKNKYESDTSSNGRVSLQEAFDYMLENHRESKKGRQHPEIYFDFNPADFYFFD